jgi:hypothetical protein
MNLRDAARAASSTSSVFSNSFASYFFRTLATHFQTSVSSNPFQINRFRTLCKIPGIGYPPPSLFSPLRFTQNGFCGGNSSLATHPRHIPHGDENSVAATPLESALIEVLILKNLKLFRMNTYEKYRGEGVLLLTRNVPPSFLRVSNGWTPCTLPLRPAILDGHSMKRHGHYFSDPILSSPRPGRGQHRRETLFTSHESPVTSHESRVTSHV